MTTFNVGDKVTTGFVDYIVVKVRDGGRFDVRADGDDYLYENCDPEVFTLKERARKNDAPDGYVSVEIKRVAEENDWCEDGQRRTMRRLGIEPDREFVGRLVIEFTGSEARPGANRISDSVIENIINNLNDSTKVGRAYRFVKQEAL